jgi:hypothetical protein
VNKNILERLADLSFLSMINRNTVNMSTKFGEDMFQTLPFIEIQNFEKIEKFRKNRFTKIFLGRSFPKT